LQHKRSTENEKKQLQGRNVDKITKLLQIIYATTVERSKESDTNKGAGLLDRYRENKIVISGAFR
jgi:hypothetical protein